jgi:hypothetical protein
MFPKRLILCVLLAITACPTLAKAQSHPAAINLIPADAIICVELSDPKALLDVLASDKACNAVSSLPAYQTLASNPKFKEFQMVIKMFEVSLETDWRTGLAALTGGGITLAVRPDNTVIAVMDAQDEQKLNKLHELLLNIARGEADKAGQPGRVTSAEYKGVTGWTFNGKEAHAVIGRRLIFANNSEGLKAALDLSKSPEGGSLAANEKYLAAKKAAGIKCIGTVYANAEPLKYIPGLAKVLQQDKTNPLAALFFAPIIEAVRNSTWLALGLNVQDDALAVEAHLDGKGIDPEGPSGFAVPAKPDHGAMPNLSVPRSVAAVSLYRDLHSFYKYKDELFGERTSGLIFFENMMGIFFSGRDLTDEVLAETTPHMRLVVARQEYDQAKGTPEVQIPAFALILSLRNSKQFSEVAEEAWQKAIGLVNFTRGQQAMPGLIIDKPVHGDTKFSVAYFSTAGMEETTRLPTRFNIRPSLAVSGDYLIISSTDGLTRDLIDAVKHQTDEGASAIAKTHSIAELSGGELATILQANFKSMVRKNMIDKGSSQEDAERSVGILITIAKFIDHMELSIGTEDGLTKARAELHLDME